MGLGVLLLGRKRERRESVLLFFLFDFVFFICFCFSICCLFMRRQLTFFVPCP